MVLAIAASFDPVEPTYSSSFKLPILGCPVKVICNGRSFVPTASFCTELGLDLDAQRAELARWSWGETRNLVWTDVTGTTHVDEVIERNSIFAWLCTLDPEDVRPALREWLEAYQAEAAEVFGCGSTLV